MNIFIFCISCAVTFVLQIAFDVDGNIGTYLVLSIISGLCAANLSYNIKNNKKNRNDKQDKQ